MSEAKLILGDCLAVLRTLDDCSVDAVVTDPPAGIAFMNREWDRDKGGRDAWVAWMTDVASECLRVVKPGGHALVWSLPRTSHWTAWAWEDAAWEIRDKIAHLFGSGFPKYQNISAFIDRRLGAEPEVVGPSPSARPAKRRGGGGFDSDVGEGEAGEYMLTAPVTSEAKRFEGWTSALKPAREDWILCRKPLDGTLADNVLKWGVGGLHIDANRVHRATDDVSGWAASGTDYEAAKGFIDGGAFAISPRTPEEVQAVLSKGRYPAHLLLTHAPGCDDGCVQGCPTGLMNEQEDGAARFFTTFLYQPKPSRAERELGLTNRKAEAVNDGRDTSIDNPYQRGDTERLNTHVSVKAIALMRWLVRLITPPGGLVLDPFMGSGSTGMAALLEGCSFTGIEREEEYMKIAEARVRWAARTAGGGDTIDLFRPEPSVTVVG